MVAVSIIVSILQGASNAPAVQASVLLLTTRGALVSNTFLVVAFIFTLVTCERPRISQHYM